MQDKALLRPGRIDRIVYVGLPDPDARRHIFQGHLRKVPTDGTIDVTQLVEKVRFTSSYSSSILTPDKDGILLWS